ncbi:hypothetical protein BDF19DRAFT_433301 [Syncephalis fuscata]|nr:hypothetical protein BDF19DRAFT_433301 [Syncephalis fuscata]
MVVQTLKTLWARICHYFTLFRMYYIRWILNPYPRKDSREHTILIVGDGNAFGFGDKWKASTPGVAGYMESCIRRETAIRQSWRVMNRGQFGTTSADWAPTSHVDGSKTESLIETVLKEKTAIEAEIAMVILGSHDSEMKISSKQTIENLRAVCEILGQHGSRLVYLVNLSTMHDNASDTDEPSNNVVCNDLLQEYFKTAPDYIKAGPRIDSEYFEFNRTDLFTPDRQYLSSLGYEKLAKDWLLEARPELVKREFAVFQKLMAKQQG